MKKSNIIVGTIVLLIISAALLAILNPNILGRRHSEFVKVEQGNLDVAVTAEGEIVPKGMIRINASPVFRVKANLIGQIKIKSIVPEGTVVKAGQEIAQLDQDAIMQAVQAANLEAQSLKDQAIKATADTATLLRDIRYGLSTLKINMEISQINMEQSLYDPPAAQRKTKLEYEKSKIAYEQAYQNYLQRKMQAESNIVSLQQRAETALKKQTEIHKLLSATTVRAPKSGIISHYVDLSGNRRGEGALLSPQDLTVAVMPDMSTLVSQCRLSEDDLSKVKPNQEVKVRIKILDDRSFKGKISEISSIPSILNGIKYYSLNIKLTPYAAELKPQMTTLNDIKISNVKNALYIPKTAVIKENGKHFVYTKDLKKQEILVGGSNSESISILKGLAIDEIVYANIPSNKSKFKQINL